VGNLVIGFGFQMDGNMLSPSNCSWRPCFSLYFQRSPDIVFFRIGLCGFYRGLLAADVNLGPRNQSTYIDQYFWSLLKYCALLKLNV